MAIALAEAGAGITPVTQRMVRLRPTRSPLVRLPVPAHREVVVRVRTAQRQRASVDRVVRTLAAIARD